MTKVRELGKKKEQKGGQSDQSGGRQMFQEPKENSGH